MLSSCEREIANVLVEALVEYGLVENLAPWGDNSTMNWYYDNKMNEFGFDAKSGSSKVCFMHDDLCGWTIKVGFSSKLNCDYAAREYEMYCLAEGRGFGYYFPETIYLGEYGGRPFYLQELADCDEDQVSSAWYEKICDGYVEEGNDYDSDCVWDEVDALDDWERVELLFGDRELCQFLWDNDINDLHEGNFGWIGDKIVIIDFSGWRS